MTPTLALTLAMLAALPVAIWIYNQLIKDRNQVANAWSDIDVQLVRRHELIPRLVTAVQAYADYERATLTAVTELRANSLGTAHLPTRAGIEDRLAAAVRDVIAVAEAYPDLKADENFRELQASLIEVEDHLQYARRFYNGAVRIYNTRIASFPHLLLARPLSFRAAEFFDADEAAEATPQVRL